MSTLATHQQPNTGFLVFPAGRLRVRLFCLWFSTSLAIRVLYMQVAGGKASFDVLLTSYDFMMGKNDRPRLAKLTWEYIIIDEGHRLKNAGCKLNAEIKMYTTGSRLLLTGQQDMLLDSPATTNITCMQRYEMTLSVEPPPPLMGP